MCKSSSNDVQCGQPVASSFGSVFSISPEMHQLLLPHVSQLEWISDESYLDYFNATSIEELTAALKDEDSE